MAITRSIIKIYGDSSLSTLVKTVTTNSDVDTIDVSNLTEGTAYWATVQVTDSGVQSEESEGYCFYTLPQVTFPEAPVVNGVDIKFETEVSTNDVHIQRNGIFYTEQGGAISKPIAVYGTTISYINELKKLKPNTNYVLTPFVMDEFGRTWQNTEEMVILRTTSEVPSIKLSSIKATSTTVIGNVSVISDVELSDLEVVLRPDGGGAAITATGYRTEAGTQQFTATGLLPNTKYNITATATNVGGTSTATEDFKTLLVSASVTLDNATLNVSSKTDSVDVEASGSVDSGANIDDVGVVFFTSNSTVGSPVGNVYTSRDTISTTATGLPSGTTLYAFAYMNYSVGVERYTVYSESERVVTVPVMAFTSQSVQEDSCYGTFTITGNNLTDYTVQYKAPNDINWTNARIGMDFRSYSISNLNRGVTYSLRGQATNESGTYTTPTSTFTTTAAGTCTFTNNSEWSTAQNSYDIIMPYTSTYDIDSATILVANDSSFTNPTTYTAVVTGTDTGTISCHTTNYGYVAGNLYYFKVMAIDSNGTTFTDEHSSTCPTATPVITDTGSGLSMSVMRYEVRCSATNTYALSNMEIKWASDSAMTTNVGTKNQSMSGTSANVSYNITYRIPASGQYIYVQLTASDVYGNTGILSLSDRVPMDILTVSSTYTNSGPTYTFTQSVSPTPPPTALRNNYITYRIEGTGQSGWQRSNVEAPLNPVTVTFPPNTYEIMGCVQDIYGLVSKTDIFKITVADPYIEECVYTNGEIKCTVVFHPDITMTTCELCYDDGTTTNRQRITPRNGTYTINNVGVGNYEIWIEGSDSYGYNYISNVVKCEVL